jgi:Leucine-rich repeat (LRR) protein
LPETLPHNLVGYNGKGIYAANSSIEVAGTLKNTGDYPIDFLNLSYNKIKKLEEPIISVCNMDLSHNEIHSISSVVFEKVRGGSLNNPCHVNFSDNKLTNFSVDWFDHIDATKIHLDFSRNLIRNVSGISKKKYASDFVLDRQLDLSENILDKFPVDLLEHVQKLTHLNLSRNQIDNIRVFKTKYYENTWEKHYHFDQLDLSFNNIKEFSLRDFGNVTVDYLNVSHNKIELISKEVEFWDKNFKAHKYFKFVDMTHNQIKFLPIRMFHLIGSEHFDLSYNHIKDFQDYGDFVDSIIKLLDISHNKIKELSMKALSKIKCDTLDLSFNKIENFKEFEDVKFIETLILKSNHITTIPFQTFPKSAIKNLFLTNNRIVLKHGIFPENVKYLDLRHNRLKHVYESHFLHYRKLQILRLEANEIHQNFLTHDIKESSIKKLGIARNPFTCEVLSDILKLLVEGGIDYQLKDLPVLLKANRSVTLPAEGTGKLVFDRSNINGIGCIEKI